VARIVLVQMIRAGWDVEESQVAPGPCRRVRSSQSRTKLFVPAGAPDQASGGERSSPSQV
jgi:hypothetical protein